MGDSYFEKRKKELGLVSDSSTDFFTKRKMDLGIIPDTRPDPAALKKQKDEETRAQIMQLGFSDPANINESPIAKVTQALTQVETTPATPKKGTFQKIMDTIQYPFDRMAYHAAPKANYIGGETVDGATNPRERLAAQQREAGRDTTGNATMDKVGDFVGQAAAIFTPGQGVSTGKLFNNPLTNKVVGSIGNKLGTGLGGRVAQEAAREGLVGAGQMAQYELATSGDLEEAAKQAAYGAAGGAIGGAAVPVVGAAFKKFAGTKIGESLSTFINRNKSVTPELEQAAKEALAPTSTVEVAGKLRPATQDQYLNRIMGTLKQEVDQIMTPPLENPSELAKWLQPHMGDSLNEIRKLSYDDMVELATEIKNNMSMYNVLSDVARTKGYNLDDIFAGKLPSIQQKVSTDASKRAYGIYDTPQLDIARPVSKAEPLQPKSKPAGSLLGDLKDALTEQPTSGISALGKRMNEYDRSALDSTKSQLTSKSIKEPITAKEAIQSGYRKVVDDLYRFKDFDDFAEKTLGRKLNPSEQTHTLALNSRGSDMISHHILTEDLVDLNGNVVGRSLKNASQQIPKNQLIDFEDYQVLKHAVTRMERGEKVYRDNLNMTLDKVKQKVADYETKHPEWVPLNDEFVKYSENIGQHWLVDTGLVKAEEWQGYLAANPNYTPNFRKFSDIEKVGGSSKGKGFVAGNPIKKAVGSQRKIISPLESRIEQTDQYVKSGKRNQVLQTVVNTVKKDPEAFEGFIEILPMSDDLSKRAFQQLNDIRAAEGPDGVVGFINDNFDNLFKPSKQIGKKDLDNVVPVMFNGEPTYIRVHDAPLLEAISSLSPKAQGVIMDTARKVTGTMKLLTTGVNPVFSLTRNLIRDIPMSYIASKTTNNPLRFTWDLMDSVVQIMGNKDMYRSFKAIGGGHSSPIAADRNLLIQSKNAILPQRNRLKNFGEKAKGAIENFNNALETAPRLGEYKRATLAGGNSPDSKIQGLFEANDVTVNFKRRGNVSHEVDAFMPYFNAAIQGLDKTFRTYKDKPVAAVAKSIAAITVPSVFLFAINYDNPNYNNLDERTKDNYYLIPKKDGTFYKLPKPREAGVPFGSAVERILRAWLQDDPDSFKGFAENARVAFLPPGLSGLTAPGLSFPERLESAIVGDSILGPLSDIRANKDFAGRSIVPGYLQGNSPELQYDARTSELSKKLGAKIGSSPKQLDYLLKSYTGVIGQLGIPATSKGGSIKDTLERQVTADPLYSNSFSQNFYEIKDKLEQANKDSKTLGEPTPDYNPDLLTAYNRVESRISEIRKEMRRLENDPNISTSEYNEKSKQYQQMINDLLKQAVEYATN